MTVSNDNITAGPYTGNGVSDTFSYGFRVEDKTEMKVYETDDAGVRTLLTVDTDYTVNDVGSESGTVVRLAGPLPTGYKWFIRSNYADTQETDFESQGGFYPDVHEKAIDKLTRLVQQIKDLLSRSLSVDDAFSGNYDLTLPDPVEGDILRWTADGIEGITVGEILAEIGTIVGDLGMNNNRITDVAKAIESGDAVNLAQVSELLFNAGVDGVLPVIHPRQIGDNSTTVFSTPATGTANANAGAFFVTLSGVPQRPATDFTIDQITGNLTFLQDGVTYAPATNAKIDITYFNPYTFDTADDTLIIATGTTTPRTLGDRFANVVNVKDFGAVGDYDTNDTAAINAAFAAANAGDVVYIPRGSYKYIGSLDLPTGVHVVGDGAANMQPAPLLADDKIYMRTGFKHLIPGSNIIFSGSSDKTYTTTRSDRFSSFGYAVKTAQDAPVKFEGIGFIQDMDVLDAGGVLTTPVTDNRADYDVGFLIDDCGHNKCIDVLVFGYWTVSGLVISSRGDGANPDYNYFTQSSFNGDIGVSLIGRDSLGDGTEGLSGTTFVECKLYARNHHDRTQTDPAELGTNILYIDGFITVNNKISGHKFIGCELRSAVEIPVQLDNCEDVAFIGCNTEMTNNALYPGDVQYITGTSNTKRVIVNSCRMFSSFIQMRRLATQIEGPLLIDEDSGGVSYFVKNGMGIRLGASDEISNDPVINLSRGDFNGITKEWAIRYGASGDLDINFNNSNKLKLDQDGNLTLGGQLKGITSTGAREVRTISAGSITLLRNSSLLAVATEGGAATDDLDTISGAQEGDIIILTAFSGGNTVVVKDSTNIRLAGGVDFPLDNNEDTITLIYTVSGFWVEVSRSDNGV